MKCLPLLLIALLGLTQACGYMDRDLFTDEAEYQKSFQTMELEAMHLYGGRYGCGMGGFRLYGVGISGSGAAAHGVGVDDLTLTLGSTHINAGRQINPITGEALVPMEAQEEDEGLNDAQQKLVDHALQGNRYFVETVTKNTHTEFNKLMSKTTHSHRSHQSNYQHKLKSSYQTRT